MRRYLNDPRQIDWTKYETAYGNASEILPGVLLDLISARSSKSLAAALEIENHLTHQQVQVHSACVPALSFLIEALPHSSIGVTQKILLTILGISRAASDEFWRVKPDWVTTLVTELQANKAIFEEYTTSLDDDVACYAVEITKNLNGLQRTSGI